MSDLESKHKEGTNLSKLFNVIVKDAIEANSVYGYCMYLLEKGVNINAKDKDQSSSYCML